MDYKEKVIALLDSKELSQEQKEKLESIFPELAESEDERISCEITEFLVDFNNGEYERPNENTIDSWLSWLEKQGEKEKFIKKELERISGYRDEAIKRLNELEKQGEQKPADTRTTGYWHVEDVEQMSNNKVKPKFKVGDKVLVDGKVYTIKLVNEDNYIVDENGIDVQEHFSYTKDWKLYEQNNAWSEEDETALGDALWCCEQAASIAKDENDMGNIWYAETWLKNLKDRVQPQPRQEWSEEDKRILLTLTKYLENKAGGIDGWECSFLSNWLKSLRPQSQWKPSKEQLEALEHSLGDYNIKIFEDRYEILKSLYNELKKLKE